MIDILVILDRSGSMQAARADHEGGLKSFVEDQKALPTDTRFTLAQFDDNNPCEIVYDRVPLGDVGDIQLIPRGGTPLYDGIGKALAHLAGRQVSDPSDQTIVMVITDGEDTGDVEWTKEMVVARKKELEAKDWSFLFLGANVDAFSEAGKLGIAAAQAASYIPMPHSVGAMYNTLSNKIGATRVLRSRGVGASAASGSMAFYATDQSSITAGTAVATGLSAIEQEIQKNSNIATDGHTVTVTTTTGETK